MRIVYKGNCIRMTCGESGLVVSVPLFNSVPLVKCTRNVAAHARQHVTKHLVYVQLSVLRDASVPRVRFFFMTNVYHVISVPLFNIVPPVKYTRNVEALAQLHVIKHLGCALISVFRVVSVPMV